MGNLALPNVKAIIGAFLAMDAAISFLQSFNSYQNTLNAAINASGNVVPSLVTFIVEYIKNTFSPASIVMGFVASLIVFSQQN